MPVGASSSKIRRKTDDVIIQSSGDSGLNRGAAIKVLSADLADSVARRRFQQEAQLTSSLNRVLSRSTARIRQAGSSAS